MIEDLFNKSKYLILFKIFIFNIIFANNDLNMIQDKIFPGYHPICKNICVDLGFKIDQNNPYLGLQWLISHNMIIDGKTSVNLNSNDDTDIVAHNIIGAKLILKQTQNSKYIFSLSGNKLRNTNSGHYTWMQSSLMYIIKIKKASLQFVVDQVQINNSNSSKINLVASRNIYKDIFLYLGLSRPIDSESDSLDAFLSLGFNL